VLGTTCGTGADVRPASRLGCKSKRAVELDWAAEVRRWAVVASCATCSGGNIIL
jgi:hypothetical protein